MGTKATTKSKLTLSVDRKHVAMLRRASARHGKSITELVEELAEREEREGSSGTDPGDAWVKRNLGLLAKKVKPSDWKREDRMGDLLRKHAPRNARTR
jgi:hypothetical protein